MKLKDSKLTIFGCGKMGEAILGGLLAAQSITPTQLYAITRRSERASALQDSYAISAATTAAALLEPADTVLLCVKPQNALALLTEHRERLEGKLLISICAGLKIRALQEALPQTRIIRAMPNTPSLIREGMSVISASATSTESDMDLAEEIFSAVGRCRRLEEKHLDAVTGLSGSGPAFVCVVLEAMADGGVMMGLPRDVAVELAAQTMQGAAKLVLASHQHPASLKDQVTTPAGCTIAGLLMMEDGKIRSTLARTIQEATRVASSLG